VTEIKDIYLNKELRVGGFYELSIQVCPSSNIEPIKSYTEYLKSLENVDGPFDRNFELTNIEIEYFEHEWILNLENISIPFKTYNIHENEPIETGFNWFDIYFYTETIEKLFGEEYKTWDKNPKCPNELTDFFNKTITDLNNIYKFQLAMIDFEISGQYYLADLNKDLNNLTNSKFFVNEENAHLISERNKRIVKIISG
jgi:hypothetical protein